MRVHTLAPLLVVTCAAAQARHPQKTHPATQAVPAPFELPITRVALYKNGVGFFEHAGRVSGDQSVTIDFTSAQLNDVLQSLTAIDLNGGRISGAGYNSTTPLEQQLKTLPLALSDDPSDVDFYNAIRGARVSVAGPGVAITGRLLSIDLRPEIKKSDADETNKADRRFLTVVSDSGQVRTLELTQGVSVTLVDSALHTDVTRYLELLSNARNQGLRHLTLLDRAPNGGGTAARDLRVSYISEVPVWKSTYRILFTDAKDANATLQGWSVVDNTTGTDWTNVHLDLVAGAPQSFIQPLSTPYYTRRVEVPLPQEAQLNPQTHDSGGSSEELTSANQMVVLPNDNRALHGMAKHKALAAGVMGGMPGGVAGGVLGGTGSAPPIMAMAQSQIDYAEAAESSITPQTTTAAFDDFFQYSLTDPITIRKNESALVPILQTKLPIERVTLWSAQQPVALRALWLTNSSTLTLDRGSFSIVENGSFGGEGLFDPIHPGERRLLSYAADQAVRVTPSNGSEDSRKVTRLRISGGVLRQSIVYIDEQNYTIHNAAPETRTVVLETPVLNGYTLDSASKPYETTPAVYRFKVTATPKADAHLQVAQRRTAVESFRLVERQEDQLLLILRNDHASPALLAQLQPVFDLHHQVLALDQQIGARQKEIADITANQNRLRENMKALKGSPEERALLTRYTGELNTQEDRISALNKELADLRIHREATDHDFQQKLQTLDIDEAV